MPNVNDLTNSRFLKQDDCEPPVLVTIKDYELVNVAPADQKEDKKYVLHFEEDVKPLVLNKTNGSLISVITRSGDFDNWIGHKIVLFKDPSISFGGKLVGGIRVRAPRNQGAVKAASPQPGPDNSAGPDLDEEVPF